MKDVDVAIMVGGFPRKAGMERKDVMSKNVSIYASQAAALEKLASKDVKVWQIEHLGSCAAPLSASLSLGTPTSSLAAACIGLMHKGSWYCNLNTPASSGNLLAGRKTPPIPLIQ